MITNRHAKRSAARKTASAEGASHETPCSRILVILLAFVALTIQTLVIQSHVHSPQAAGNVPSINLVTLAGSTTDATGDHSAGAPRDKIPVGEDPSNCPLCQAFGHLSQFVASAAVLFALPYFITVNPIVFSESDSTRFAVSHSWQGRAPPQR